MKVGISEKKSQIMQIIVIYLFISEQAVALSDILLELASDHNLSAQRKQRSLNTASCAYYV